MDEIFEKSQDNLNLIFLDSKDVLDFAKTIASNFDKIIKDNDLDDKLNTIMKQVIFLLEQTNLLIKEKENLQLSLLNCENEINQLEFEFKENKLEKNRCQKDFEQIEDAFRSENKELLNIVSKLKDENFKLKNLIKIEIFEKNDQELLENLNEIENFNQKLLLEEKKEKQELQKELNLRIESCEKLENELAEEKKKLEKINKKLLNYKEENVFLSSQNDFKLEQIEKQSEILNELRNLLERTIQDHLDEQENLLNTNLIISSSCDSNLSLNRQFLIENLKKQLIKFQTIQKLAETLSIAFESMKKSDSLTAINFEESINIKLKELEIKQQKISSSIENSCFNSPTHSIDTDFLITNNSNKNLPQTKFTLIEIRNILLERNSLKNQVKYLENKLSQKNNSKNIKNDLETIKVDLDNTEKEILNEESSSSIEPDFLPVQGPINKEPDEKLFPYKRMNSTFLKIFPILKMKRNN